MAQKQAKNSKSAKSPQRRTPERQASGSGFSGKDILHVIVIALVCTVIFAGIGVVIAMSKGISVAQTTGGGTEGEATQVAVNGTVVPTDTPIPTATEIPCEAQTWWDGISATTGKVVDDATKIEVDLPPQQIKTAQTNFNTWDTALSGATSLPPCVQAAQQALEAAASQTGKLYGLYLSPTKQTDRAQQYLNVMDAYLKVTDELGKLNVTVKEDWFKSVQDFTRGDCPARRWYIEQFILKDYQRFFTTLANLHIQNMNGSDLQNTLVDFRNLGSGFKTDMASFPACLQSVSNHYTTAVNTAVQALNDALNNNMKPVDGLMVTVTSEKTAFQTELNKIDPAALGKQTANL